MNSYSHGAKRLGESPHFWQIGAFDLCFRYAKGDRVVFAPRCFFHPGEAMSTESKDCACWDEPLNTAFRLLSRKLATPRQIQAAVEFCRENRPKIGALALVEGKLKVREVFQILGEQATTNEVFGEIAVRLGFLDRSTLRELLWLQVERSPKLEDVLAQQGVISYRQRSELPRPGRHQHHRFAFLVDVD